MNIQNDKGKAEADQVVVKRRPEDLYSYRVSLSPEDEQYVVTVGGVSVALTARGDA